MPIIVFQARRYSFQAHRQKPILNLALQQSHLPLSLSLLNQTKFSITKSQSTTNTMPKFALFVRANAETETGAPPKTSMLEEMSVFNASLASAGVLLAADGLLPSSTSARVTYTPSGDPADAKVTRGPFPAESLVAGFWIITAKDFDEALDWAKKVPFHGPEDPVVEVRQVASLEDFGDEVTPELKEKQDEIKAGMAKYE
ncbi:hypothetical protein B0H63DRAFT_489973 [Podospora didyma]|uniref:YCII-related domain-containing protein n=1 Tax=Podospora didyma TaxID=330526 RepID=A0AAE0N2N5_9PEZI|nr:hypothetical protein B0H63DRAFT_489973 [Podospora didyma]